MPPHPESDTAVHAQDYPLDAEQLRALWRMEERHFWHRAHNRWILRVLARRRFRPGRSFLEVGCGGGFVAASLHREGFDVTGIDLTEELLRKARQR